MSDTFRARIDAICAHLPGAEKSDPWGGGHDAWKVGGKMFACIGAVAEGVSVKCRDIETASLLKESGVAVNAPYFHKSWVRFLEDAEQEELAARIVQSYDLVRSKLPMKVKNALPERAGLEGF